MNTTLTICYLGMYAEVFSRTKIYSRGLRARGISIIECRDASPGIRKYWRLWRKHAALQESYDILIVGYLEHILVPLAKLISSRPVVADMLGSLADAELHSHVPSLWRTMKNRLIDWLAVRCADVVLLESEAQRAFFIQRYGDHKKFTVLYTGVDESVLYCVSTQVRTRHLVLFRGKLTPESGIFHILEAARLLKSRSDIDFRIIGTHYRLAAPVRDMLREYELTNVEFINEHLSDADLRAAMCEATIALGQFESNPRLDRTIPHKTFEAMYMNLPFITARSQAVEELLTDGESCLFVRRADPTDLADKIAMLIDDPVLAKRLAEHARDVYNRVCSNEVLVTRLLGILIEQLRIIDDI